jgi:hypothetical protein
LFELFLQTAYAAGSVCARVPIKGDTFEFASVRARVECECQAQVIAVARAGRQLGERQVELRPFFVVEAKHGNTAIFDSINDRAYLVRLCLFLLIFRHSDILMTSPLSRDSSPLHHKVQAGASTEYCTCVIY